VRRETLRAENSLASFHQMTSTLDQGSLLSGLSLRQGEAQAIRSGDDELIPETPVISQTDQCPLNLHEGATLYAHASRFDPLMM
jgi:hypothetical protein